MLSKEKKKSADYINLLNRLGGAGGKDRHYIIRVVPLFFKTGATENVTR